LLTIHTQGHRRLVIATVSDFQLAKEFDIQDRFDRTIRVDPVKNVEELDRILSELQAFDPESIIRISRTLTQSDTEGGKLNLGVKRILLDWEQARDQAKKERNYQEQMIASERGDQRVSTERLRYEQQELEAREMRDRAERFVHLIQSRLMG
jgi:hypothetical protein